VSSTETITGDANGTDAGRPANPITAPGHAPVTPEQTLSPNQLNGLVHLYRAEVGKLTAFRTRLDTTTSWSVTTSALVCTFALGNSSISHATFIFLMFVLFFFLQLEARRFEAYEASRYRVVMLERFFYPGLLGYRVAPKWLDQLTEALRSPQRHVNHLGAMGWRLRRTYLWINVAVLGAWLTKLNLDMTHPFSLGRLESHAAIGSVPGWAVLLLVGGYYAALICIAVGARLIYPLGDEESREFMAATPEA
jgi:uncharacterized membrane protein